MIPTLLDSIKMSFGTDDSVFSRVRSYLRKQAKLLTENQDRSLPDIIAALNASRKMYLIQADERAYRDFKSIVQS